MEDDKPLLPPPPKKKVNSSDSKSKKQTSTPQATQKVGDPVEDISMPTLGFEGMKGYDNYGFTGTNFIMYSKDEYNKFKSLKTKEEKLKYAKELYAKKYLPIVQDLPVPLQIVAGDFNFNSENPFPSLMVAAGIITPDDKIKLYTKDNGSTLRNYKVSDTDKKAIIDAYNKDPQGFLDRFDTERRRSYAGTQGVTPETLKEWNERVDYTRAAANKYLTSGKPQTIEKDKTSSRSSGYSAPEEAPYTTEEAFDKIGIDRLNRLRGQFNLPPIAYGDPRSETYKAQVRKAAGEMQIASIEQYPELIYNYYTEKNITPTGKMAQILGSRGYGKKIGPNKYTATNADLKRAIADNKITKQEILDSHVDNLWHFRGLTLDKKKLSKDEYEAKMKEANILQGEKKYFTDDPARPYVYTEYYTDEEKPEETKKEEETPDVEYEHLDDSYLPDYAPWWLQDQIAIAGDVLDLARIKKYRPWQATPDTDFIDPTFYDPTRELAANAEAANMSMQTAQAFTNPQQATAASLAAQAQLAKSNADVLGRYNTMNVQVANQTEMANTSIYNQASLNKANQATQLYDKNTIANQQFDNSRNMARQKLRQDYINAITNRQMTANLNELYPQYAVDPSSGGRMFFHDPKEFKAAAKSEDVDSYYKEYMKDQRTTPAVALQLAKLKAGIPDNMDPYNANPFARFPYFNGEE